MKLSCAIRTGLVATMATLLPACGSQGTSADDASTPGEISTAPAAASEPADLAGIDIAGARMEIEGQDAILLSAGDGTVMCSISEGGGMVGGLTSAGGAKLRLVSFGKMVETSVTTEAGSEWLIDPEDASVPPPQIEISGKTMTVKGIWQDGSGGKAQGTLTVRCG